MCEHGRKVYVCLYPESVSIYLSLDGLFSARKQSAEVQWWRSQYFGVAFRNFDMRSIIRHGEGLQIDATRVETAVPDHARHLSGIASASGWPCIRWGCECCRKMNGARGAKKSCSRRASLIVQMMIFVPDFGHTSSWRHVAGTSAETEKQKWKQKQNHKLQWE